MLYILLSSILLDDGARLQSVLSLRAAQTSQNYEKLSEAMSSDLNDKVRLAAAEGLLFYDGPKPLEALENFLRVEPGEHVRKSICELFSNSALHAGDPQATALLSERLRQDPSPKVRLAAAAALETRKDRRALKALFSAMKDDDDVAVRQRARRAHKILSKAPEPAAPSEMKEPAKAEPYEPQKGRDPCGGLQGWCECALAIPPTILPARCLTLEDCQRKYDDFLRRNGYRCSWDGRPLE